MAKSKVITLTLPEKLLKQLDKRAKRDGMTRAELMRQSCRRILEDDGEVQYWEDDKGNFGLHFPHGIEAGKFLDEWEVTTKKIEKEEKKQ